MTGQRLAVGVADTGLEVRVGSLERAEVYMV